MADLHQPDLSVSEVLDEFGVDGLIARAYAGPKRIAMLRIHHATENAQTAVDWVADVIAYAIANPALYRAEIVENAQTLAAKLRVLADELEKSVPVVSLREGEELAQTRGLRREDQEATTEKRDGRRDPPDRPAGDWGDVPF